MNEISKARFDAYVGYARAPEVAVVAVEIAWFESQGSELFAVVIVDQDEEYSGIAFTADLAGRFRWSAQTAFFSGIPDAVEALASLASRVLSDLGSYREQGDESGAPTDFFRPRVPLDRQHPSFRRIAEGATYQAARSLIEVMMCWYQDRDGNFIEQLQTTGFDARVWELYLWATFTSLGYEVTMPKPNPDFVLRGLDGTFAIEATTINPTIGADGAAAPSLRPSEPEDVRAYGEHYLPIRYAGPLTSKLAKRYWDNPQVAGLPLALAIQDFHDTFSMTYSQGGLVAYLYGVSLFEVLDDRRRTARLTEHSWGTKTIPSGFFEQDDAEHISAVIFNSQGTISKFTRMAIKCGFEPGRVMINHSGWRLDVSGLDPERVPFSDIVHIDYPEDWVDGMDVFHNPRALRPLDAALVPGAAHHFFNASGGIETLYPQGHVLTSNTTHIVPTAGA